MKNNKKLENETPESLREISEQQAEIIKEIALPIMLLNIEYCKKAADDMINQASRQDSMAVLYPQHSLTKNRILEAKGKALKYLVKYAQTLKEISKLTTDLTLEQANMDFLKKYFTY